MRRKQNGGTDVSGTLEFVQLANVEFDYCTFEVLMLFPYPLVQRVTCHVFS